MFSIDQENTVERGVKYFIHGLGIKHFQSTQNTSTNLTSSPNPLDHQRHHPHANRSSFIKFSHQSSQKHSKQKENYPKKQKTKLTAIALSTKLRMEKAQFFNKFQELGSKFNSTTKTQTKQSESIYFKYALFNFKVN